MSDRELRFEADGPLKDCEAKIEQALQEVIPHLLGLAGEDGYENAPDTGVLVNWTLGFAVAPSNDEGQWIMWVHPAGQPDYISLGLLEQGSQQIKKRV